MTSSPSPRPRSRRRRPRAVVRWLGLLAGFAAASARAQNRPALYRGTMHSYCPDFDYHDPLQITVNGDNTASAVVPSRGASYTSQGTLGSDGVITGLSIRVNSLSRGLLTIPYSATLRNNGASLTGTGSSGNIQVDVQASRTVAFFAGERALSNGVFYLPFPNGNNFGIYSYLSDPRYLYHYDLGYEYVFDANDGNSGVYLYDFASDTFFYTSPSFPFPYLYDFRLKTVLYYFQGTTNPRYFANLVTGAIITK